MNNNKLNLKQGDRRYDGSRRLSFWGKFQEDLHNRKMIYVFFDDEDNYVELTSQQVIKLNTKKI